MRITRNGGVAEDELARVHENGRTGAPASLEVNRGINDPIGNVMADGVRLSVVLEWRRRVGHVSGESDRGATTAEATRPG